MESFVYEVLEGKVVFGYESLSKVKEMVNWIGGKRVLIISTKGRKEIAEKVATDLSNLFTSIYDKAVQHVPIETVEDALKQVDTLNIDSIVAVGGGSPIGLAKAIALRMGLPIIAIPTTYAGSEMTAVWGMTKDGEKRTGKNKIVKPKGVIYDPKLTLSLPQNISVTSGMNAFAHCVEGIYSENANPITSLMAEEGMKAIIDSLPKIQKNLNDLEARKRAFYGAFLGGTVLGTVGMALHHKICHVLGGSFNLPHAETHTAILPYALWYNLNHSKEVKEVLSRIFNTKPEKVPGKLFDFIFQFGIPTSIQELGMKEDNLKEAASIIVRSTTFNPRPVDEESIYRLLTYAYHGERPKENEEI